MSSSRRYRWLVICLLVSSTACDRSPTGNETRTSSAAGGVVESADQVIRKVAGFYKSVKSARVELSQTIRSTADPSQSPPPLTYEVSMERPGKLAVRDVNSAWFAITSDGHAALLVNNQLKQFVETSLGNFDELAKNPGALMAGGWGVMFLPSLLSRDPYEAIMTGVTATEYVGSDPIDGTAAHHIRFQQPNVNWEMWIAAVGDPVLLQLEFEQSPWATALPPGGRFSVRFRNWQTNVAIDRDQFDLKPPPEFAKAETPDAVLGRLLSGPEYTVGKAAPDIEGKTLFSKPFNLRETTAGKVVLLDFWATWCGPCVIELPILMQLAQDYQDQGVVLYAVNQGEGPELIREFLVSKKWNLNVILDPDGMHGQAYGVEGLPRLVIIDQQGIIRRVHVGFRPDIDTTLRQELDQLLAGNRSESSTSGPDP